jgi:uncharacterized protein (DUF433 family)
MPIEAGAVRGSRGQACQRRDHRQGGRVKLPARIDIRPEVMRGKPCIKGTRIPVYLLLQKMAAGETAAVILAAYPQLHPADLTACLDYASQLATEEIVLASA